MRTIRIKLYKFNELSNDAKLNAVNDEVEKFTNYFAIEHTDNVLDTVNAIKRIDAYQYEFLQDGTKYNF